MTPNPAFEKDLARRAARAPSLPGKFGMIEMAQDPVDPVTDSGPFRTFRRVATR